MPKEAPNDSTAVNDRLLEWLTNGDEFAPNGMPAHPELVYRLTGDWRGWAYFLGDSASLPDCSDSDRVDEAAYHQFLIAGSVYRNLLNLVVEQKGTARLEELDSEMESRRRGTPPADPGPQPCTGGTGPHIAAFAP